MDTEYAVKRGEFSWALEQLKRSKKVTRPCWGIATCLFISTETKKRLPFIAIHCSITNKYGPWIPSHDDILADDWQLAEE